MAIAATYLTTASFTTSAALYTVPTGTSATYAYARDLVITNSGTVTAFVAVSPQATAATTTGSFAIPTGGSVILTQCQVPASTIVFGVQGVATTTTQVSIGYATNVAYI